MQLVRDSGKSVGAVARDLDLTEMALRSWLRQAGIDAGRGAAGALTTDEREELARLRRENRAAGDAGARPVARDRRRLEDGEGPATRGDGDSQH